MDFSFDFDWSHRYNTLTLFPALFRSVHSMSLNSYFRESLTELHRVTWPTREQATKIVIVTLIFVLVSALVFGVLDQVLAFGYAKLLQFAQTTK